MKNILYIGNVLQGHGKTPTTIETLSPLLSEFINVRMVSDKKNMLLRLFDMLYSIIKYRKTTDYILIDTYSTTSFYYAFLCSRVAKMCGIAYFPFLHGGNLPNRLEKSPYLCKKLFGEAEINVSPSAFLDEKFRKYGYKVQYIPNNINLEEYEFLERKEPRAKLLYVRAFSEIYNPLMAVIVLKRMHENFASSYLCMVGPDKGDGSFQKTFELADNLSLTSFFEQTGRLSKDEWKCLSKDYCFLINPTNFDNMPVSVIEAMALGLIVISTNAGGLPYLIEDGVDGFLVETNDDKAMFEKIERLMQNPEKCSEVSKNARKKAENFDWKKIALEWQKLFKVDS